jgi:PIN domain nuclease of toxin-antitoxin system
MPPRSPIPASAWEITVKFGLGKLPLPDEPDRFISAMRQRAGVDLLPIAEAEVCQVHKLPPLHRDPFDRILVAQANCHGLMIVTDDIWIGRYPVRTLW